MSRRDGSIYVGRLRKSTRARDLEDIFEPYGRMLRCDIKYGAEMAYAFIDFEDRRDAEDCVKYEHGRELDGQSIIVEWAKGGRDRRMQRRPDSSSQSYDECFRCHRTGHWARDCPEMRFGRGGGGGRGGGRWRSQSPRQRYDNRRRRSRSDSRDQRRKRSRSTSGNRKRSRSGSRKSRSPSNDQNKNRRSKSGSRDKRSASGSKSRSRSLRRSMSGSKSRSKSPQQQPDNNNEQQANGDSPKGDRGADDYGDDGGHRSRSGSKD